MTRIFRTDCGRFNPIIEKSKTCPEPWSKDLKCHEEVTHGTENVNAA